MKTRTTETILVLALSLGLILGGINLGRKALSQVQTAIAQLHTVLEPTLEETK